MYMLVEPNDWCVLRDSSCMGFDKAYAMNAIISGILLRILELAIAVVG